MAILADISKPSHLELEVARLRQENEALRAARQTKLAIKVTDKGGLSVYGLGRFPVTLYKGQWERLIEAVPAIKAEIVAAGPALSVKE